MSALPPAAVAARPTVSAAIRAAGVLRVGPYALARAAGSAVHASSRKTAAAVPLGIRSTRGKFYYQGREVPRSIFSTGKVGTYRDLAGSDGVFFGVDPCPVEMDVLSGRGRQFSLDDNGFQMAQHAWDHVDYYDNNAVLERYYPECEALVCRETGASMAVAFDHNIRSKGKKDEGKQIGGGNIVQEPLITYGVHNDYTANSAPSRIRQLAEAPRRNDTRRNRGTLEGRAEALLRGRWLFVNVWRNITDTPVQRFPLGLCDAASTSIDDLVVFEIRYVDRVGENYFVGHSPSHRWYYFPELTKDEAVLLKCWDSRGRDFLRHMPGQEGKEARSVPATFSLHSAFEDPTTPPEAPDRESMEVRLIAFYQEEGSEVEQR